MLCKNKECEHRSDNHDAYWCETCKICIEVDEECILDKWVNENLKYD